MIAGFFGIILILVFIALVIGSKVFRWAVVVFIGICAIGIVALLIISNENSKKHERERESSRRLMIPSEIELSDMTLQTSGGDLKGRLRNKSAYFVVSEVGIEVTLQDCNAAGCETVGQTSATISALTPPGQARDFSQYVYFSNSPNARRGKLERKYQIKYVEAHLP